MIQIYFITMSRKGSVGNTNNICVRCQQFEVDLTNTSDDLSATDAELKASRQVISLLQRQLEISRREKDTLEKLLIVKQTKQQEHERKQRDDQELNIDGANSSDKEFQLFKYLQEHVYATDEELIKCKSRMNELSNEKGQLATKLAVYQDENETLKNENRILKDSLTLRDKTILSLSNEVFESSTDNPKFVKNQRGFIKLVDTLDAYKKTNESLSDNVIKLTDKCNSLEKRESEARSHSQELEAKCCQIQSKLLSLLKEIAQQQQPTGQADQQLDDQTDKDTSQLQEAISGDRVKMLIKRLLEDKSLEIPLSWKEGNSGQTMRTTNLDSFNDRLANSKYECDELGFYFITMDEASNQVDVNGLGEVSRTRLASLPSPVDQNTTDAASSGDHVKPYGNFDHKSCENIKKNILRQMSIDATKNDEMSWRLKWDYFIKDLDKIDLSKSKEFKNLLRSGVPQEYRCKVWKTLVNLRIKNIRDTHGPDYYQSLLEPNKKPNLNSMGPMNQATKQIELDLLRTLPNNKHFETLDSSGTIRLRRVLTAYSEHNPRVGYCQGMNRLAAVALLVLPEEEAFWCLVTIVDDIMPKGYYNDLWLAQVDSSVVMNFIALKMPNLSDHFRSNNIDLSLFAWFLTIFVDGTPPSLFLRLWDSFLYEGDKVLFRVSLALMKMYESKLMKLYNSVAINNFLRSNVNAPMDFDYFFSIAFEWMNPLSSRSIRNKRQQNLQLIKSGLEPSDTTTYRNHSPHSSDKEDFDKRYSQDESDSNII